tara:strand:- start:1125 stop:1871 length:747 start_codon:yes stop_codon:yes gene_type:complete
MLYSIEDILEKKRKPLDSYGNSSVNSTKHERTNMTPKILQDVESYLKQYQIDIHENVEGEGRGGSLVDEGTVKRALRKDEKLRPHILDKRPRGMADMEVLGYDKVTKHVTNIKTSLGNNDNCFSKAGLVYALTDLEPEDIPKSMNFIQMDDLINKHKADIPEKDYWYCCVDKKDSRNVLIRGAKQIATWTININPSNILQINWGKEKTLPPVQRTWEEAYDVLINNAKRSLNRFWANVPQEWKSNEWK